MKTLALILLLLSARHLAAQTQDSTDIKLQQYKDYFDKGLITQTDYNLLKDKLLNLGRFAPHTHLLPNTGVMQYNKKTTFEIRIEPSIFFGLPGVYKTAGYNSYNGNYNNTEKLQEQQYGGIDFGFGAAFSKRYHIHFNLGFDGNGQTHTISTGVDANINLIKGRVSPFIHLGGGYASTEFADDDEWAFNGFYTAGGIGVFIQLTKFCAIDVSPDYRFIYGYVKNTSAATDTHPASWETERLFIHQLGVKMAMVFY